MKLSTIFQRAARYAETCAASCVYYEALGHAEPGGRTAEYFAAEYHDGLPPIQTALTQQERVLFFCFMSAIAAAEGR